MFRATHTPMARKWVPRADWRQRWHRGTGTAHNVRQPGRSAPSVPLAQGLLHTRSPPRTASPSCSLATGGEPKPWEGGHQAGKLGGSQLSSPTLGTTPGAIWALSQPYTKGAGSPRGLTEASRRNPMDWRRRSTSLKPWKSPSTFPAAVFPLLRGREAVAGGGRHFGEHVYRTPAKPQEVPAPGDEEWAEEEADVAKALSTPLHCHWQTKARAQQRCCAWPCGMQEGLESSPFAVLSQSSQQMKSSSKEG